MLTALLSLGLFISKTKPELVSQSAHCHVMGSIQNGDHLHVFSDPLHVGGDVVPLSSGFDDPVLLTEVSNIAMLSDIEQLCDEGDFFTCFRTWVS